MGEMIYPRDIKMGDVFIFEDREWVALKHTEPRNGTFRQCWCTTKQFFDDKYLYNKKGVMNSGFIYISTQQQIERVDNVADILHPKNIDNEIQRKLTENQIDKDPDRLYKFYKRLCFVHKKYVPQWRFTQLLANFITKYGDLSTLFYWSEEEFLLRLEHFMEDFELDEDT